ncbi:unnamed protein product [Malus baccata var. baccata]
MGKAGWPWLAEKECRSCYSSSHLKTGASSSDLGTIMKNKERGRDLYLPNTVTRSEVTGKALGVHGFAGKVGVLAPKRSRGKTYVKMEGLNFQITTKVQPG